ncbi:uncharacterized protein LOC113147536 [Cyclospora cayetanensis]|uniref:Uncharacterized protein LOC113147536 n=1 Tax=Cyclospora cayetanensis TaxID=88456 RepID=A0A6P6S204_9EIME|nr:uncharacterized protein LOC113147536 [Cyclospora cayetanensis]
MKYSFHTQNRQASFSDVGQVLQPSTLLPACKERVVEESVGQSFSPYRLASIYNLSIRYWDEGCAFLATRTLQEALMLAQHQGLSGGCIAHTWEIMEVLGGPRRKKLLSSPTTASCCEGTKRKLDVRGRYLRSRQYFSRRMFVAAERELEEVRGHLGSLLCYASLRGYNHAEDGRRRCAKIKEALDRVEDDLLLLQELQARYSRPKHLKWGENMHPQDLHRLVNLSLMPCMRQRIQLQKEVPNAGSTSGEACEQWVRTFQQALQGYIRANQNAI